MAFAVVLTTATLANAGNDRADRPRDIALPGGYKIEAVVTGLDFPSAVTFDQEGTIYIAESGNPPGVARILRVGAGGTTTQIGDTFDPPLTGIAFHDGWLYASHNSKITRLRPNGSAREDLITGLPSQGDHQNDQIAFGKDGKLYFTQGSATNSGVVGLDNYAAGWLEMSPQFHDFVCADVRVRATNYTTANPLTADPSDSATTGPFQPFGTPATEGQLVPGQVKCNGSVLRANADGSGLEVVAWGFRNPFGLGFDDQGQLWLSNNGLDERGSRHVAHGAETFNRVVMGHWYGWPDFSGGIPVTDPRYAPAETGPVRLVFSEHPPLSPHATPFANFASHSSAGGFDFSSSRRFGFEGDAFVAESGSFPNTTGAEGFIGYRVTRVDHETGAVTVFLANRSGLPAFVSGENGINKPIDVKFDPADGEIMYVVDLGVINKPDLSLPNTGVLWRVAKGGSAFNGGGNKNQSSRHVLGPARPNPSTGQVSLVYTLNEDARVTIGIYNPAGRLIRSLVQGDLGTGPHEAVWDGMDGAGRRVAPGAYFYRMEANGERSARKLLIMRP